MDSSKNMIIAKGEFLTDEILSCEKNTVTNKWDIKFKNGASYNAWHLGVDEI